MPAPRVLFALLGAVLTLVLAEAIARIDGDRVCVETPGAFYQADPRFGWSHVPHLAGRAGRCVGRPLPAVPVDTNALGLLDQERPRAKRPGTARLLLLGGILPEGLGVAPGERLARLLEARADRRRGSRLEVINGGTGGWALDNALLFFLHEGRRYSPDLVLLVVDPATELPALSPRWLRAREQAIPAKPSVRLGTYGFPALAEPEGALLPLDGAPEPAASAVPQLYRNLRHLPSRTGPLLGWIDPETLGAPVESGRDVVEAIRLARMLLRTFRDEVRAAGGRLVVVLAPVPHGRRDDAALAERVLLGLRIPVIELGGMFAWLEKHTGRTGYLTDSGRWDHEGHFFAAEKIWSTLATAGLLPPGVVSVAVLDGGRVLELPQSAAALRALFAAIRHALPVRFVLLGLLAAAILWTGAVLPAGARDWLLVGVSLALLAALAGPALALVALGFAVVFELALELVPGRLGRALTVGLLVGWTAVPLLWWLGWRADYHGELRWCVAFGVNFALLRFVAHAVDRRAGAPRRPLREYLAAMLFFPTFVAGPFESVEEFVAGRMPGGPAPETAAALRAELRGAARALARLAWGATKALAAIWFLNLATPDVFATRGALLPRLGLWVWAAETLAFLYLVFSGASDVAIALGALAGSRVRENFRAPWSPGDVADYWRRWETSLGGWLRRYVYAPLGGAARAGVAVPATFLASGLWLVWVGVGVFTLELYRPRAWGALFAWAPINAGAVLALGWWRRWRGATRAHPGPAGRAWRALATLAVAALAWLPVLMPPWNTLADYGAVVLRLAGVR